MIFKYSNIFPSKCNQNAIHHLTRVNSQLTISIPSNSSKEKQNHSIFYFIIRLYISKEGTPIKITNEGVKSVLFIKVDTFFFFFFSLSMKYVSVSSQLTGDPRFQIRRRSSFPASRSWDIRGRRLKNGDEENRRPPRLPPRVNYVSLELARKV